MRRLAGLRGTFALTGSMLTTHTFHTVTGSSHKDRVSQTLAYLRTQRWSFAQENVPRGLVGFQLPSIPHASCSNVLEKGSHQASSFLGGRKGFRRKKKDCILATCTLYLLLCISMLRLTIPHCWMVLLDDRKPFKCRKLMYGIQMTQL